MKMNDLDFEQLPRDAGQTVEVTYAVDWESETLYSRHHDRNDNSVTVYRADITGGEFEAQNNALPEHGEWTPADEATAAAKGRGLHYRSTEWQRLAECVQWPGIWPVIDADGELTGEISEGTEEESNVDDEAMIDTDEARAAGWKVEDGHASPPQPVAVEFAVADETIRTCALDDLLGLEHTADDAGREAARKIVEAAEAAEIQ